jgi:AraC family carnitine catabolism transcriptional activator
MFHGRADRLPQRIGFLLLPRFSHMALASAMEPLRMANALAARRLYQWVLVSTDGEPVRASNDMSTVVDCPLASAPVLPAITVVASYEPERAATRPVIDWLRRRAAFGAAVGALDTGSVVLARAGLLDGCRATVHWELIESFASAFPRVHVVQDIFVVDGDRFTSAGATAALDMMLNLIRVQHGHDLAAAVADEFIYARIRDSRDAQRMPLRQRLATSNPRLIRAVEMMESTIAEPLSLPAVADHAGVSIRELERMFRRWLKTTPGTYYRRLRLDRARTMLQQTAMPVIDIAVACGFGSAAHFSRAYRARFGRSPRRDRGIEG